MAQKIISSLYLPGGGTLVAWQVGFIGALQKRGVVFDSILTSSAGTISGLLYVSSILKGITVMDIVNSYDFRTLSNLKALNFKNWHKDIVRTLQTGDLNEVRLFDRAKYGSLFEDIFASDSVEAFFMPDIYEEGIIFGTQFVEDIDKDKKKPILFDVSNFSREMKNIEFGEYIAIAMCFPALLGYANDFFNSVGLKTETNSNIIDGDLFTKKTSKKQEFIKDASDWLKGNSSSNSTLALLTDIRSFTWWGIFKYFSGVGYLDRNPEMLRNSNMEVVFYTPRKKNPLSFIGVNEEIKIGYRLGMEFDLSRLGD